MHAPSVFRYTRLAHFEGLPLYLEREGVVRRGRRSHAVVSVLQMRFCFDYFAIRLIFFYEINFKFISDIVVYTLMTLMNKNDTFYYLNDSEYELTHVF